MAIGKVQTIAERRKANARPTEVTTSPVFQNVEVVEPPHEVSQNTNIDSTFVKEAKLPDTNIITQQISVEPNTTDTTPNISFDPVASGITKEMLTAIANKYGYQIKAKELFIKHTYQVTAKHKEQFKDYCDTLNIQMSFALQEAMNLFFEKYETTYNKIKIAKPL